MSLKSSLLAFATLATLLAGSLSPAHAITATINPQRAAKAKEPRLAYECSLRPHHIWIYNPDPEQVGFCQNNTPAPPLVTRPNWENAGNNDWCRFTGCPKTW